MKIIALSEKQRRKIIKLVEPQKKDMYSYQNLNLLTAVYDAEKKIYLTSAYFLPASIKRTSEQYDDYTYILITPLGYFRIKCIEMEGKYRGVFSPLPILISNRKIMEMIQYYNNSVFERLRLEKQIKNSMELEGKGFTEWYLDKYYWLRKE